MRKWLFLNPWIWIVLFLGSVVAGSVVVVVIAEMAKPEIVKVKPPKVTSTVEAEPLARLG